MEQLKSNENQKTSDLTLSLYHRADTKMLGKVFLNTEGIDVISFHHSVKNVYEEVNLLRPNIVCIEEELHEIIESDILEKIKNNCNTVFIILTNRSRMQKPDKLFLNIESIGIDHLPRTIQTISAIYNIAENKAPIKCDKRQILSKREIEVMSYLEKGHSYKMISDRMEVGVETVRTFVKRIFTKLNVHSAIEAINVYRGMGQ